MRRYIKPNKKGTTLFDHALIIGAGHGIGLSITQELLENYSHVNIHATYRILEHAHSLLELQRIYPQRLHLTCLDPVEENQIKEYAEALKSKHIKLDLVINCVGLLHDETIKPEKSLRNFDPSHFMKVMMVNALVTPLLGKHFIHLLSEEAIFAALSAKVGSIKDNGLGGWYSYRASKAALNMLIKNMAIEFKRQKPKCIVLAIHPGTTQTSLSSPFLGNTHYQVHSAQTTAKNILSVISAQTAESSGKFLSWDGSEIPW